MRIVLRTLWLTLGLTAAMPAVAQAQVGPFIDWLQKMSGPRFARVGLTYRWLYNAGQYMNPKEIASLQTAYDVAARTRVSDARSDSILRQTRSCIDSVFLRSYSTPAPYGFDEARVDRLRSEARQLRRRLIEGRVGPQFEVVSREICDWETRADVLFDTVASRDKGRGIVLRLGVFHGHDRFNVYRDEVIYAWTLQGTIEGRYTFVPRRLELGLEAGAAYNRYTGDIDEEFGGFSFPIYLNYYPFSRCSSWLLRNTRLGFGPNFFRFPRNAFAPLYTLEERSEVVWTFFLAVDLSRSALKDAPTLDCE